MWWLPFLLLAACYGREAPNVQSKPQLPYARAVAEGQRLRKSGEYSRAAVLFAQAAVEARRSGETLPQGKALLYKASCELLLFRYREATQTLNQAEKMAVAAHDATLNGQVAVNQATLYYQLGDFASAELAGRQSVEDLRTSPRQDHYILALDNLAGIEFGQNRSLLGKALFREALTLAKINRLTSIEANVSDNFGIWLVLNNDLGEAEPLLRRAFAIRNEQANAADLLISHEHLAELEQKKGRVFLASALHHVNIALAQMSKSSRNPRYYPLHVRGSIYRDLGQSAEALIDFQQSVAEADVWQQSALPGDATNTKTVAQLAAVYQDYYQLAAAVSVASHNLILARDAFSVLARHRAVTLREQLTRVNRSKFLNAPQYLSLLGQLQSAQADVSLGGNKGKTDETRKNLDAIRAQLNDLENRLGLDKDFVVALGENNRKRNLLKDIQSGLGEHAALLSFSLGDAHSYLWTVTSTELTLHQLAGRKTVEEQVRQFRAAVHESAKRPALNRAGQALSQMLFSQIPAAVASKPTWLIAPDGELLNAMPFAALPVRFDGGAEQSLVSSHSLRVLPGAVLPGAKTAPTHTADAFLGIGDPIYNRADARFDRKTAPPPVSAKPTRYTTLARLVASEKELKASAQACALPHNYLLTGRDASGVHLRQSTTSVDPRIIHFAVHVISPEGKPAEAALALSLNSAGVPELLTAEVVSTLRTPGALVVLSGCASSQGDIVPGSGLVGLSRSWLLAGAEAVMVSAWPTPDESGQFFSKFYEHYRQTEGAVSKRAADALRQTQIEMARSGGYRADAAFWAAYSIVSKE